ncbi:unnamed protein product [Paramecium octaurelia]|uniref:Protein kinase domain-containing protein n=1 Tax=Paramecium octaurelia TaxID=43137 RepID=A0A8S1WVQ6_PAROT|nr:unnamed protein product [Paramecium octaurelia]
MKRFDLFYEFSNQQLGQGVFGQVYLAKKKTTQEQVAVKILPKNNQLTLSEIEILNELVKHSHPAIVRIIDVYDQGTQVYVVQEFCNSGTLFDFMKKKPQYLGEEHCIEILEQVAQGLDYLHKINIVHRDIKPENILRTTYNGQIYYKISDFGLGCIGDVKLTSKFGTAYYVAPEIIDGRAELYGYDKTVDIWALGLMFDELLHGTPFFDGHTEDEVFIKIRNEPYYPRKHEYSGSRLPPRKQIVANILMGMINKEPNQRKSLPWILDLIRQYKQNVTNSSISLLNQVPFTQAPISPLLINDLDVIQDRKSIYQQKCAIHNQPAIYRMPIKDQDNDVSRIVSACSKCLRSIGVYELDTLQKKVDEALRILTMENFDQFFTQSYIKQELKEMRVEYFLNYSYFSIRDDQLQSKYDAILMDQQKKAKIEYTTKIKQLVNFRDKNYTSDEQWLIYVAEKLTDSTENEFVLYIKEDLAQFSEHGVEDCRQLILNHLKEASDQLSSLI